MIATETEREIAEICEAAGLVVESTALVGGVGSTPHNVAYIRPIAPLPRRLKRLRAAVTAVGAAYQIRHLAGRPFDELHFYED